MLLLLEGDVVHFPAPKSHYSQDLLMEKDTPIFCTSSDEIRMVKGGAVVERETEMMKVRWNHFTLYAQIPVQEQRRIPPCKRCFALMILQK